MTYHEDLILDQLEQALRDVRQLCVQAGNAGIDVEHDQTTLTAWRKGRTDLPDMPNHFIRRSKL